jgi:hypothetical protein
MARLSGLGQKTCMTRFRCLPMDADAAQRFRATRRDDRGGEIQTREVDGPGFPCRACLRLGQKGETMLLASWDLPLPQGPYWTPSPVFLHAHDCGGVALEDALPETVLGVVVPGDEAEAALRARIGDPRVAYVNIHTARPGCWLTRVEKV